MTAPATPKLPTQITRTKTTVVVEVAEQTALLVRPVVHGKVIVLVCLFCNDPLGEILLANDPGCPCEADDDCSDEYVCKNGFCSTA